MSCDSSILNEGILFLNKTRYREIGMGNSWGREGNSFTMKKRGSWQIDEGFSLLKLDQPIVPILFQIGKNGNNLIALKSTPRPRRNP